VADYLRVEQRRARARATAVHLLQEGVGIDDLTLRRIARAMGTSTSTLTYAYPTIGALLDDLAREQSTNMWHAMLSQVESGGLQTELMAIVRRYFLYGIGDRARSALIRYSIGSTVSDRRKPRHVDGDEDVRLIILIGERAHEHYRAEPRTLAALLDSMIYGLTLTWVATGDEEAWWHSATAGVQALTLLADPQPLGIPQVPRETFAVPDRRTEWSPAFHAYSEVSQPRDSEAGVGVQR
jgi:AcrR family transcriptional regulator